MDKAEYYKAELEKSANDPHCHTITIQRFGLKGLLEENAKLKAQVKAFENESDDELMLRVLERDLNPDDLHNLDCRESGESP